ncbi:unnamed protein product [Ectocarpus sp. 8 AP-2014]
MGVPLGSALPSASSNKSSSSSSSSRRKQQQQQQQQQLWPSREVGGKEFHTTGSFPEGRGGGVVVRDGGDATERQVGRAPGGGGGGGGLGSARSESGMSRLLSRRRGMGIGGPPVGKDARQMFHEGSKSNSDDMPPPPPSPMLTGHLRRARDSTRGETKQQKQQAEVLPAGGLAASGHRGCGGGGCGGGARPQNGDEDDGLGAAAPPRPGCPAGGPRDDDNAHSPSDVPPPPSPMLTGHLRCGPGQENRAPAKLPAGRGRGAFKGRGVRPQTWHEDDRPAEEGGGGGSSPPRPCGIAAAAAGVRQAKGGGGLHLAGGEAQQQKQQQQKQQNQMRLVVRDPKAAAASSSNHDACFLNDQVSPGALSMVSCSTTYSRLSAIGGGGATDGNFNDSDKHLDTLARVAADIARRGASANAELVTGLGRGAFEKITVSPGTRPRRGNDLAGVSKAIPAAAAVASVPSLESRSTAVTAAPTTIGKWTAADAYGARPHVLNSQPSRSELFVDDESSVSSDDDGCSASSGGYSSGVRLEPPSLTVAHAPGRIYQPVTAGSQQYQKQAVGRGTPATHSNGLHHHHHAAAPGDGDGAPPFRLPSDMRLMSFGSRASSVVSPRLSGAVELSKVAEAVAAAAAAAYDAKSDLARRPTKLEMLSTFGSHSHGRLSGGDAGYGGTDGSHANAGDEKPRSGGGSGGKGREYQRRSSSGTRRSSRREDRISQRRSRSSGSHGGGTRRFNNAGGGLSLAESDKRSGSRDRRFSSSRSISVEWRSGGGVKEEGMDGGVAAADSKKTAGPLAEEGVLGDPSGGAAAADVEVVVAAGPSLSSPTARRATSFSKESCRRWSRVLKKPPVAPSNPRPASARKTPTKKRKVRAFLAIASIFRKKSRGRSGSCSSSSGGSVVGNGGDADDEERTAAAIATAAVGSNCRDGPAGRSSNAGGGGTASSNRSSSINLLRGFNRMESRELTNAAHNNRHGGPGGLVGWLWKRITRQDPPRRRRGRRASGGSSSFGGSGLSPASSSSSGSSGYVSGVSPMITARMGSAGHQQQHGDRRVVLVAEGPESSAKSPAGNNPLQNQQPMSVGNPLCALRPKSASHNFKSNGSSICPEQQHRSGAGVGAGAVSGGGGGGGGGGGAAAAAAGASPSSTMPRRPTTPRRRARRLAGWTAGARAGGFRPRRGGGGCSSCSAPASCT